MKFRIELRFTIEAENYYCALEQLGKTADFLKIARRISVKKLQRRYRYRSVHRKPTEQTPGAIQ